MAGSIKIFNRNFGCSLLLFLLIYSCGRNDLGEPASLQLFRRSVLDQQARMLTLKYDGDHYLAYDLKNMVPNQFWTGGVLWNGAAFNNIKTIQPTSYGNIYWQGNDATVYWKVVRDGKSMDFDIQFKSYEILDDQQIAFQYQVTCDQYTFEIGEIPKLFYRDDSVLLVRYFSIENLPKSTKIFAGNFAITDGSQQQLAFLKEEKPERPQELSSDNGAQYWLDRSGCNTCHQLAEQNIGPAYLQIADRYDASDEIQKILIENVKNGSTGKWGMAQMIPHPDLSERDIRNMVRYILSLKPNRSTPKKIAREENIGEDATKPGFGSALIGVHPSFDLVKIRPEHFKPRVGGMNLTKDGDLLVSTWDSIGAVYRLENIKSYHADSLIIKMIASGLAEPLGITTVGGEIYVMQKHELTRLVDLDGDGITDKYECVTNDFGVTPDFHEFSYGLIHHQGKFYGSLGLAMRLMSNELQNEDRGTVFSVDDNRTFEILARGLRQPNGIGLGPEDEIFVTENQGQWVPACKLIQVQKDRFYGCQFGTGDRFKDIVETLPAVYLPQDEIGNSPGEPVLLKNGPYAGQMIWGDVTHGGIKRAFLEKVNGEYQGCVFRFTQGMEAGINRLALDNDGNIYAGGVGMNGGWAHKEHQFGLEKLHFNGKVTFEVKSVKITPEGFLLEFTSALDRDMSFDRSKIHISQWRYESTENYGGPKIDRQDLRIDDFVVSDDRRQVSINVPGIKKGYVVYFLLDDHLKDENGQYLWSGETWYTVKNFADLKNPL